MDTFIYLHGFNSSGASAKGRYFSHALAPAKVYTPSLPPDPDAAMTMLHALVAARLEQLTSNAGLYLIGSSLGGYYAQYLARVYTLPAILLNPALRPLITLAPFLGWQRNFYTGERYLFGRAELAKLAAYAIEQPCADPVATLLLLDAGDELIDYRNAMELYSTCARVIVYPDGDHSFQHLPEAAIAIREFVSKMRTRPQI